MARVTPQNQGPLVVLGHAEIEAEPGEIGDCLAAGSGIGAMFLPCRDRGAAAGLIGIGDLEEATTRWGA